MHVIAAKAVSLKEALQPDFAAYARQVVANAKILASCLLQHGFNLVSGGTDNHLLLVDLRNKGLTGKQAEEALGRAGITVNKNSVPFDTESPLVTSGIRIGTAAVTTRGMKEREMEEIAALIARILHKTGDEKMQEEVRHRVAALCAAFPLYEE
jgi:glycine hydroxymethyltransferase